MRHDKDVDTGLLTLSELRNAECILVKRVQKVEYAAEIGLLCEGNPVMRTSHIKGLDPVLMNGLLVVGVRLKHAPLSTAERHPSILPPRHALSRLILHEAHGRAHLGTEWVLSCVRQKHWIPGARNTLRSIRRQCVVCQRLFGKPCIQKMADLPVERCTPGPVAFTHVGVDLFGHFNVVRGRSTVKRYGCIFTCFSTRAIHIEVLESLETDAFINGFRRFCSRRGQPKL